MKRAFFTLAVCPPPSRNTAQTNLMSVEVSVVCDACLVFIPLHMLRGLRLHKTDRYLVRMVFSGSALLSFTSVGGTICILIYFPDRARGLATIELVFQLKVSAVIVKNLSLVLTMDLGRSGTISIQLYRRDTVHLSPVQKDRTVCIDTDISPHRRLDGRDDNHRTSGNTTSQSSWTSCSSSRAFARRRSCPAHI